jgi:hypothetical protein
MDIFSQFHGTFLHNTLIPYQIFKEGKTQSNFKEYNIISKTIINNTGSY